MTEILNEILQKFKQKKIIFLVKDIERHPNFKRDNTLQDIANLSNWLYIIDEKDLAVKVASIIDNIPFEGDFVIWNSVVRALSIEALVYEENGELEKANKCISIIKSTFNIGSESEIIKRKKILNRVLNGSLLNDDKILIAKQNNDIQSEITWRFNQFKGLLYIKIMGGSEIYPIERLNAEIVNEKQFLKNNIGIAE